MNVLEMILEEIRDNAKLGNMRWDSIRIEKVEEIIRSHMDDLSCEKDMKITRSSRDNNGWIPVEERLPEEYESVFARYKGTDKWVNAMWEKSSDEVNVTYECEDKEKNRYIFSYGLHG